MSVVINSNAAATMASNNLASSNAMLQRSLNRLSSGSKIVSPADDAGGLAVSMKLSAAARRSGAASTNIGNTMSYLQTQDGALQVAGKVLDRMSELRTLFDDPTKNATDKANYDAEFRQLGAQLESLAAEQFNGINLFGTTGNVTSVAVSEDGSQTVAISSKELNSGSIAAVIAEATSVDGSDDPDGTLGDITLAAINGAIQQVATMRANNGAEQSRLDFASEVLTVNKANLEAANSRIVDVDVAAESTQLARFNTLVQAGTSMLAQANQSSQIALRLLQ